MTATARRPTDFGVVRPGAKYPAMALTRDHDRFADVRAYRLGIMPTVRIGQVWADLDPRCAGRTVRIVEILANGKAMTQTVTPRTVAPRTPGRCTRDTVGAVTDISVRRFRPGCRGFRLVEDAPKPRPKRGKRTLSKKKVQIAPVTGPSQHPARSDYFNDPVIAEGVASLLATGTPVMQVDRRAAAALCGLLGDDLAVTFLVEGVRSQERSPVRRYCEEGVAALLSDAVTWATRKGLFAQWARESFPKRPASLD